MSFFGSVGKAFASAFGFGGKPMPNSRPNGGDGVMAYSGYLASGERDHRLQGTQKWVTYADAYNVGIIATGVRYRAALLAGTKWHAKPNPLGGKDGKRGAEIVERGLLTAQMPATWPQVVKKIAVELLGGFSLHEWSTRTSRVHNQIVFAELANRPSHTIDRWDKPSEQEPWSAVSQLTRNGNRFVIPRARLLYAVDSTLTNSPEGVGLMRHVIGLVHRLTVLEGLELIGYETNLRGMPIARAPLAELRAAASEGADGSTRTPEQITQYVADRTRVLRDVLANVFKTPEKLPYLLLDAEAYREIGPGMAGVVSTIQKWSFEILKGDAAGLPDINVLIKRIQLELARILGIEFALIGDGAGTLSTHLDKTQMFATSLQATLTEIAQFATNDLARTLVGLNGLDPETCTPELIAQPISTEAVDATCRALSLLAQAGLKPNDPAINVIRDRLNLPDAPEDDPEAMGLLGARRRPLGGPPDPALGEKDIPVDDLGTGNRQAA